MRNRRDPWKWPVSIGLTVSLLLAAVFVVPRSWLDFLLAPQADIAVVAGRGRNPVLHLLPPLSVEVVPSPKVTPPPVVKPPPEPAADPRWWTEGWAAKTVADEALFVSPAAPDTVAVVLQALGLGADFMSRARPDSVLASRLFILQVEEDFRYDELKPYLSQMARSRAYADILSRAADMYNEHLDKTVQVPD